MVGRIRYGSHCSVGISESNQPGLGEVQIQLKSYLHVKGDIAEASNSLGILTTIIYTEQRNQCFEWIQFILITVVDFSYSITA